VDNPGVARALAEIADLLEIKGENPFRVRSYRLAAESVETSSLDVASSESSCSKCPSRCG